MQNAKRFDVGAKTVGDERGARQIGSGQNHGKFLAAITSQEIVRAQQACGQFRRHAPQTVVPGRMGPSGRCNL